MWRKICHVEKFQIYMHDRCGEIWNFSTFEVISNFSTWQMWRNLTFLHMLSNFKFFHMTDVEKSEVSPHLASVWCEECLNICERYALLLKNWFYAVLSRNLFCRDLRTFVWRKIEPKIAYVEKKWQIWGMHSLSRRPDYALVKLCLLWMPLQGLRFVQLVFVPLAHWCPSYEMAGSIS